MPKQSKEFQELLKQQKQSKDNQKHLNELAQKVKKGALGSSAVEIVIEPPGAEKMSEVLEEFIDPYIDTVHNIEAHRSLYELAVFAWNISLLPETKQQKMVDQFIGRILLGDPQAQEETKQLISELIMRKKKYFANIKRFIADFTLKGTGKHRHLSVASTLYEVKPKDMEEI